MLKAEGNTQKEWIFHRCGIMWRMVREEDGRFHFYPLEGQHYNPQEILAQGLLKVFKAALRDAERREE